MDTGGGRKGYSCERGCEGTRESGPSTNYRLLLSQPLFFSLLWCSLFPPPPGTLFFSGYCFPSYTATPFPPCCWSLSPSFSSFILLHRILSFSMHSLSSCSHSSSNGHPLNSPEHSFPPGIPFLRLFLLLTLIPPATPPPQCSTAGLCEPPSIPCGTAHYLPKLSAKHQLPSARSTCLSAPPRPALLLLLSPPYPILHPPFLPCLAAPFRFSRLSPCFYLHYG